MATTNTQTAPVSRKRGEGPIVVRFIEEGGNETKRISDKLESIQVANKAGKNISLDLAELPDDVIAALAGFAVAKMVEVYARNHADPEKPETVLTLAQEKFSQLKEGKFYTRAEGGKAGRTFDFDMYVEIMKRALTSAKRKWTKQMLADYRAKLEAMAGKERTGHILKFMKDPHYKLAAAQVKAEYAEQEAARADSGSNAFDELF